MPTVLIRLAAVAAGIVTALVELLFLVLAGLAAAVARPRVRPVAERYALRLVAAEQRRLAIATGTPAPAPLTGSGPRVYAYLAARIVPALMAALTVGLLLVGCWLAAIVVVAVATGTMSVPDALLQVILGGALLAGNLQAILGVARLDRWLARRLLEESSREALRQRIDELAASRAEVIAAVDDERRRIERDLHDGLQQRLVTLGMLLGRARRSHDLDKTRDLLAQAHADVQRAVEEMREVAWRVYPSALTHSSLDEVLTMVAQRSTVPVKIDYTLPVRPGRRIETALYFVACEAMTNAAKHARATVITIAVGAAGTGVEMVVRDDGVGGADPDGTGLHGLARRVAALDGRFAVHSPPGDGTELRVELPCE
ncbi:histidine kinase [Actinoplanes sp. NPDC024001]|uniref:sensor histidine kinase n=1 Tax=Actinoplanes sp. NPDC024001 TaxID=3154598 RepID=UPI0033E8B4C1